jgi:hypothetical protein
MGANQQLSICKLKWMRTEVAHINPYQTVKIQARRNSPRDGEISQLYDEKPRPVIPSLRDFENEQRIVTSKGSLRRVYRTVLR